MQARPGERQAAAALPAAPGPAVALTIGIRPARDADALAIHAIYAPLVRDTHVTFEIEPPSLEEIRARIQSAPVPWLVAEEEAVEGFASAGPFRARAAYRWTAEASVYVAEAARGRGVGRALGEAILARLGSAGYRSAIGVVALPNPASEGLMRALGFRSVGVIREAGFKLDRWWDIELWQRALGDRGDQGATTGGPRDPSER